MRIENLSGGDPEKDRCEQLGYQHAMRLYMSCGEFALMLDFIGIIESNEKDGLRNFLIEILNLNRKRTKIIKNIP